MKPGLLWCAVLVLSMTAVAQDQPASQSAQAQASATPAAAMAEIQQLREAMAQQQKQIAAQQEQIERLRQMIEGAQPAPSHVLSLGQVASTSPVLPQEVASVSQSVVDNQKSTESPTSSGSPLALHYKGITLTPGGYLAAETVWRQRATAGDINTPFNSIPYGGSDAAHMSEFFGSGRQSRITLLVEGKISHARLNAFYETDWLSAATTSNNNQSNSYSNRQRQLWGQAALDSGWTFTGGQMWSLITETRRGLDNRTEALPMTIDAQYHVGFSWARQYGVRLVKNFHDRVWLGVAVEDAQATLTAHDNGSNFVLGAAGNPGGLYNSLTNYAFNPAPDLVVKTAFEPGWGHYEVFGVLSQFRDRIYPNAGAAAPSASGALNDSRAGGGLGANARGSILNKHVDVGLHFFGGQGLGRYGSVGLPDTTVRANGTLSLLRSYQGLGTLEWHSLHWDIYSNAGVEYVGRGAYLNAAGKPVGYGAPGFVNSGCLIEAVPAGGSGFLPGSPANCTGDTRNILEGSLGFWYKVYKGDKGTVQWGPQYSYEVKNSWAGTGGQPHAVDNMVFTSFRYYLP